MGAASPSRRLKIANKSTTAARIKYSPRRLTGSRAVTNWSMGCPQRTSCLKKHPQSSIRSRKIKIWFITNLSSKSRILARAFLSRASRVYSLTFPGSKSMTQWTREELGWVWVSASRSFRKWAAALVSKVRSGSEQFSKSASRHFARLIMGHH